MVDLSIVKLLNVIDNIDDAISSNITRVIIRRNLKALTNQFAQYELCFGNNFHINPEGRNIKSTGFTIQGRMMYCILLIYLIKIVMEHLMVVERVYWQ